MFCCFLNFQTIKYWGTGKNRYQMEIPEAAWKKIPHNYEVFLEDWSLYENTTRVLVSRCVSPTFSVCQSWPHELQFNYAQKHDPKPANKVVKNKRFLPFPQVQSSKRGFKRYRSPEIEALLAQLTAAEERRDTALRGCMRRVFAKFDKE